jgi:hypothetical protein
LIRWQYRAIDSRICSAGLVHTYGRGFSFQVSIHVRMSLLSCVTDVCAERLSFLVVSSPNQRSTRLIHEPLVGVKCRMNRGWVASQRLIFGVL